MRFRKSRLYISAILPIAIGIFVGILSAIMGVGGGFVMVPAMIYLLGMPTAVVVGTSLFQIIFVTANVTIPVRIQSDRGLHSSPSFADWCCYRCAIRCSFRRKNAR